MLREQRVSAFPVIDDDNKVIGVVSEADLLAKEALEGTVPRTLQSLTRQHVRSQVNAVTAADLMTKPAVTIGPDEPVTRAARLMFTMRVKRLPVISDDGTLIGIVTRSDVLSVYSRPDAEIQHAGHPGPDPGHVPVRPGQLHRHRQGRHRHHRGHAGDPRVGLDIIDAIRHMEGVVAVRDRLSYPPDSPYLPRTVT